MTPEEKVRCLEFELGTLSGIVLRDRLERWVPGFSPLVVEREHRERYLWAGPLVAGKRVCDLACGVGLGSRMLAEAGARSVVGCDLDPAVVDYAALRHAHPAVTFRTDDAERMSTPGPFEAIVSFETIEHLRDPRAFLGGVRDRLAPGGTFLISTPLSRLDLDPRPRNPHHQQEWGFRAFQRLVGEFFAIERILLQLHPPPPDFWRDLGLRIRRRLFRPPMLQPDERIPFVWDPAKLPEAALHRRVGYQILQCRGRPAGRTVG